LKKGKKLPKFSYVQKSVNKVEKTKQKSVQDIPEVVSEVHTYIELLSLYSYC